MTQPSRQMAVEERVTLTSAPSTRRRRRRVRAGVRGGGFQIHKPLTPPAAGGFVVGRANPSLTSKDGIVCIRNVESLTGINTTAAFTTIIVNCLPHSFPFLNGLAVNYSKYRWKSLKFVYIPGCSLSTPGTVSLMNQYDVPDLTPTSSAQMSVSNGFVTTPVWGGVPGCSVLSNTNSHPPGAVISHFDVTRLDKDWYPYITGPDFVALLAVAVTGPVAGNYYSPGNLIIATEGGPAVPVVAGTLFGVYEIELIEPITSSLNY